MIRSETSVGPICGEKLSHGADKQLYEVGAKTRRQKSGSALYGGRGRPAKFAKINSELQSCSKVAKEQQARPRVYLQQYRKHCGIDQPGQALGQSCQYNRGRAQIIRYLETVLLGG